MEYRVVSRKSRPGETHLFDHRTPDTVVCACGEELWPGPPRWAAGYTGPRITVGRNLKRPPEVSCPGCRRIVSRHRLAAEITGCEQHICLPSEFEVAEIKADILGTNFWALIERDDEDDWNVTVAEYGEKRPVCEGRGVSPSEALANALKGDASHA